MTEQRHTSRRPKRRNATAGTGNARTAVSGSEVGHEKPTPELPTEPLTIRVERPAHGGAVVGRASDGRTVFVRGAIPGELVKARVSAEHKKFMWADTIEVLEASEHRVPHIWPDPIEIGSAAADLGHVAASWQPVWKSLVLMDQMRRVGGEQLADRLHELYGDSIPVHSIGSDDPVATRTRIQLVADADGRLGMRPYRSDQVVPLDQVPLAVFEIQDITQFDPTMTGSKWSGKWEPGDRVEIEVPSDSSPLIVSSRGAYDVRTAAEHLGPSVWKVTVDGTERTFQVEPGGFWQTHIRAPEVLVKSVMDAAKITSGQTVMELYSGSGLFSRFLADAVGPAGLLVTLEGNSQAVEDAGANLIDAIEDDFAMVFEGNVDAESVLEVFAEVEGHLDTVVLDPPRKGAGKEVVQAIGQTDTARVVLVSCDPAAGARDIRDFLACGFQLESMEAWDLFPNTHHFETVAELVR